jgi:putative salt-induced outer membrane protein
MHLTFALAIPGLALGLSTGLSAQTPDSTPNPWKLQTDFGFISTAGNTSTTTLNAGEGASYTSGDWTASQTVAVVYGRTDGKRSAENYAAGVRADHAVSKRLGIFLMGNWSRDAFAGILRRFEEGVGLSLKAVAGPMTELRLEAGLFLNQQRNIDEGKNAFAGGRGALRFKQKLNQAAYFQQLAEVLPNFKTRQDVRLNSETALVAPISSRIAFKAGYVIKFDNLPEPGFGKTDRYLTSGLQVVF